MDKNLISKIITGEATDQEKEAYYKLLAENKEEEKLFFEMQSLWLKTQVRKPLPFEFIRSEYDAFLQKAKSGKITPTYNIRNLMKYAAILILVAGVSGMLGYVGSDLLREKRVVENREFTSEQMFSAAKGSIASVVLSDGTKISLNSGSEVVYTVAQSGERNVKLRGEAYFEVTHMQDRPFVVEVGDIRVKDLGTVFNIKAYTEDKSIETTLLSGKAEILKSSGQSITMLSPGEQAEYEKEGRVMKISPVNVEFVTGWKDGKFVFREKRLEEICRDLQNWYDVKFEIRNDALKEFKYSGTIKRTTTVGYVLKMLKVTTNINYEIVNKPVGPDLVIIN